MGEKTLDLAEFDVAGTTVLVELNYPVLRGKSPIVHVQTRGARFECSLGDFFSLASAILVAEKNLKIVKGLE